MDFLHLYDADGNEIMPELSPYEDDISPLSKVHVLDLCRKDTPPWEEPSSFCAMMTGGASASFPRC